jgi:hypothetical protein
MGHGREYEERSVPTFISSRQDDVEIYSLRLPIVPFECRYPCCYQLCIEPTETEEKCRIKLGGEGV